VESDRVDPGKFYGFSGGRFFVSTNGGATFAQTAASGLPATAKFKAVPGRGGDLWLAGDTGLFHSTDSGASFTKLSSVSKAVGIGFGKAAPGRSNPALYAMATIGGVTGVYRSDDTGATWVRINDDRHQYGNAGDAITGDPRVYGRVYLGTNGRGILYADRTGTTEPDPDPEPEPGGACAVTYGVNQWPGGFTGSVTIANTGAAPLSAWRLAFTFPAGQRVTSGWGATWTQDGANVTAGNLGHNGTLAPGASVRVGFNGSWSGSNPSPAAFTVNDNRCTTGS
jgi:cellulase/cellobiase CelA1